MTNKNKLFIAAIEIQSGEEQYITYKLIADAKSEQEAEDKVVNHFSEFCCREKFSDAFFDPKGYPAYRLEFVTQIETISDLSRVIPSI